MEQLARKMSEKQKAFCDYYIESLNLTEAAKKAGYSEKTARSMGSENLTKPDIKEYIDLRLAQMEEKRVATASEVLEYLTRVMRGEEKDQFDMDASLQDRTKAAELLGHLAVGVQTVKIVGVDDAAGPCHRLLRAKQGVDRAVRPGPARRNPVKGGKRVKGLIGVANLRRAAVQGGSPREAAAEALNQFPHLRLDDEHNPAEARPEGVVDGVFHQKLPMGADAVHLLVSAVAGAQARRHNDQRELHVSLPFPQAVPPELVLFL